MDIGYINARVRAWKGEFFDEEDYKDLLSIDSIDEFIGSLKGTSYGFDLEEAKVRFSGMPVMAVLDNGLKGNLSRTFKTIWTESPSNIRELIRLLFFIWDVHNLKAIMRGIHEGVNPDEIYSILIPAGDFDESALKELARQGDINGLIHILNTWDNPYGKPLRDRLSDYIENKEIIGLELALDRFAYDYHLNLLKGNDINTSIIRELLRERIDASNIITLFKFMEVQNSHQLINYFIKGGKRLQEDDFLELSGYEDKEAMLNRLTTAVKDKDWREKLRTIDLYDVPAFEEEMDELIRRRYCRQAVIYPLTIAVIICFYFKKVREIKNLRLIGMGKESSIPEDEIKRYLLF
jgi:V/A-type H+-transporting ATPase subunit C